LSPQSTNTDEHGNVPAPELNPMINPLLAQNMGRWAEVYFTHPPEEREQAVQELVRHLEQENKEREAQILNSPVPVGAEPTPREVRQGGERPVVCGGCGHKNPVSQRFCGMCGVALAPPASVSLERIPSTAAIPVEPETGEEVWAEAEDPATEGREGAQHYFLETRPREYESDIEPPMFGSTEPSFSYSYRIFLGLALAIVLGVLGYMAWHKGQALSQEGPQVPPPAAEQPAATDQGASQKAADTTNRSAATPAKAEDVTAKATKTGNAANEPAPDSPAAATSKADEPSAAKLAPVKKAALTPAAKTERVESNANGAEELAMAQRYLNGESGRRDPSQAAQWLWKSVAKQNSQATLLLADLYLHGDGIQKNCDQARILLDAAAQKGQSGAATRLRNLQAFGCQ